MTVPLLISPIPAPIQAPRGAAWAARTALAVSRHLSRAWHRTAASPVHGRTAETLVQLACDVQREQPDLAGDLRGIAMHLEAQATPPGALDMGGGRP